MNEDERKKEYADYVKLARSRGFKPYTFEQYRQKLAQLLTKRGEANE